MTDKEKRNVIDFLNDILINPEGFTELYSASEMKLLADNALDMLKEQHSDCESCAIAIEDREMVVRCKDCKYSASDMVCNHPQEWGNEDSRNHNNPDWFCADGEQKDE